MGWASGEILFWEVLEIFPEATLEQVRELVKAFESSDADTPNNPLSREVKILLRTGDHPHMLTIGKERGYWP
jgi:hypothetical protein